jgi:ClpP class serine protease
VWTGAEASSKKLVDSLGGFDKALDTTRTLLGYDRAERWAPEVVRAPRHPPPALDPPHLRTAAQALLFLGQALGVDVRALGFASRNERVLFWSPVASWFDG